MSQIQYFTNDNFRTLAYLYDVKNGDNKAHITQQEIGDDLGISRVTINKIIGELKNAGYIEPEGNHVGRYILTKKAISVIETFRSVEKK